MAQFMLLLHSSPEFLAGLSPEEMQAVIEKYRSWRDQVAGSQKLLGGAKLRDEGGKILRRQSERVLVTDGPFSETKEIIGGYFLVEASDYEEAATLASGCPHLTYGGRIELREVEPT